MKTLLLSLIIILNFTAFSCDIPTVVPIKIDLLWIKNDVKTILSKKNFSVDLVIPDCDIYGSSSYFLLGDERADSVNANLVSRNSTTYYQREITMSIYPKALIKIIRMSLKDGLLMSDIEDKFFNYQLNKVQNVYVRYSRRRSLVSGSWNKFLKHTAREIKIIKSQSIKDGFLRIDYQFPKLKEKNWKNY